MDALRAQYCPPLDEPLFLSLAGDYNLHDTGQVQELKLLLDNLKADAVAEQDQELATPPVPYHDDTVQRSDRGATDRINHAEGQDSILSDSQSALHPEASSADTSEFDTGSLNLVSTPEKEEYLRALFPAIESIQIQDTVSRCGGDLQQSIDELLNLSFITDDATKLHGEATPIIKGVDGFVEGKYRKSRRKRTRKQKDDLLYDSDDSALSVPMSQLSTNVWQSAVQDLEFITSRTQMSPADAKKVYEESNKNIASTIRNLIAQEADKHRAQIKDNDVLGIQASELKFSFPKIPDKYLFGSLLLCQMQPSVAKELLDAMLSQTSQQHEDPLRPGTKLSALAQYTPLILTDDEDAEPAAASPRVIAFPHHVNNYVSQAAVHDAQAQAAFASASRSARLAKSNHLYGGASAYYASVGHDARAREKALRAAAAHHFATAQSTATSLDLHGVTVADAIQIAQQKVEQWWDQLGDKKYVRGGIGTGYKIITGVGSHSENGIGRLGPAVSKALLRNGWKVNVQRGEIYVEGKSRP